MARLTWQKWKFGLLTGCLMLILPACTIAKQEALPPPPTNQPSLSEIAMQIAQLSSSEPLVRANAVEKLSRLSSKELEGFEEEMIPDLILLLQDPDLHVQDDAISVLRDVGEKSKIAVPAVIPLLKKDIPLATRNAVDMLGEIGEEAKIAIPHIIPLLKHKDVGMRSSAVSALGHIGRSEPKKVVPYMAPLLKDREPYVREATVCALIHRIGKSSTETIIPEFLSLVENDPDPHIRRHIELRHGGFIRHIIPNLIRINLNFAPLYPVLYSPYP
jgi:HEAT repeat protein